MSFYCIMNFLKTLIIGGILISAQLVNGQLIERYSDFNEYEVAVRTKKNKVYVVNYWATWCGPCVKELPFFEKLTEKYPEIEVVLVSIDFADQYESKLLPFVEKRKIQSRVIHMSDPKANDWIDRVDPSWSGSIPVTVFYKADKKLFLEKEFPTFKKLEATFLDFINQK